MKDKAMHRSNPASSAVSVPLNHDEDARLPAGQDPQDETETGGDRVIVHVAYPLWRKPTMVAVARAKELKEQGNDVRLSYCAQTGGTCAVNYAGLPVVCKICQRGVRAMGKELDLPLIPLTAGPPQQPTQTTLREKKEILHGVVSGIVSTFRTLPREVRRSRLAVGIKQRYFRTANQLLAGMKQAIADQRATRVEVFNGRHACSKFCLLAARDAGIDVNTLEVTRNHLPIVFRGHTTHDRHAIQQRMLANEANYEAADAFFSKNRTRAGNKFAKQHAEDFQPPQVQATRKVAIFLSSQDEFASLGKAWESPFEASDEVVRRLAEQYPETHFCVRFHPNQADINTDIFSPFTDLEGRNNVTLYYPTDTANTYALIDWSDVVVTFGSTLTIEACWAGKPVVLLGPSFFDSLDVAYTPADLDGFLQLMAEELSSKSRENAARAANYMLFDHDPMKYIRNVNGKLVPHGFVRRHALPLRLARYFEVVTGRALKAWVGREQRQQGRHAA